MAIHPIEFRYSTEEMRAIFEEQNIFEKKLLVEAALAKAHAAVGNIPNGAAAEIEKAIPKVTLSRAKEIEEETQHDVMAIVKALGEQCGEAGKYVHLGATSYDIVDTSWALLLVEALEVVEKRLSEFKKVLLDSAKKYQDTIMVGRSHGQHGLPITLGLKFAVWAAEAQRNLERVQQAKEVVAVGKMTGAVGTSASFGKNAAKIQEHVMKGLGLKEPLATTQVVQRDRHAQAILTLAMIGQSLEKIGKEIRNLQRTEIGEVEEPFGKKQVGSSTMPQKRNPWKSERVCGLARVLRSNVMPALENIPLEHERDLTDSSCERVILPESFVLCDFMLKEMIAIVSGLVVYPERMKENLKMSRGRNMGEAVMMALTEKGIGRQEAHELVRAAAMESFENNIKMKEALLKNAKIKELLGEKGVEHALKPENYLGATKEHINTVLKKLG
ncbi:MAG: adenylosuccinate lyase [archaeon]